MRFRELLEGVSAGDAYDAIYKAMETGDSKFDQALWDYLEQATADSGVYAGDATPDELLELLSDRQLKELHKLLTRKFKKLFEAEVNETKDEYKKNLSGIKKKIKDLDIEKDKEKIQKIIDVNITNAEMNSKIKKDIGLNEGSKNLEDYKNKTLELKELPDGASSKNYKLTVGNKYKVIDINGGNFVITDDKGTRASFSYDRFNLNEASNLDIKAFMKEFNKQVKFLKEDVKTSGLNNDWYGRLESIHILIGKQLNK